MINDIFVQESKSIQTQLKQLNKQLQKMPEGDLFCAHNGKYIKWYLSNGSSPIYIPKKERQKAEKLATKKYLQFCMNELTKRKRLLHSYGKNISTSKDSLSEFLEENECMEELLKPYFHTFSERKQAWLKEEYEKNTYHEEHLIHKTRKGDFVRSKSEVIIANALFSRKIPYRYECKLSLGNKDVFPDFTLAHPETMKICYWEHFGMMEVFNYREDAYNKLKLYGAHGIYPSINMITTYETTEYPLNSVGIEKILDDFLVQFR